MTNDRPKWMKDAAIDIHIHPSLSLQDKELTIARHYSAEAKRVKELREAAYQLVIGCEYSGSLSTRASGLRKALEDRGDRDAK